MLVTECIRMIFSSVGSYFLIACIPPHDRELFDVLHAVFEAADEEFPWKKSVDALRKSVDHELHVRQAASRKSSQ